MKRTIGLRSDSNLDGDGLVKTPPVIGPSDASHLWLGWGNYGLESPRTLEDYYGDVRLGHEDNERYTYACDDNGFTTTEPSGLPWDVINPHGESVGDVTALVVGNLYSGYDTTDVVAPGEAISLRHNAIAYNDSNGSGGFSIKSVSVSYDRRRTNVYLFSGTTNTFSIYLNGVKLTEESRTGQLNHIRYRVGAISGRKNNIAIACFKIWNRKLTDFEALQACQDAAKLYGI